ncbi:MAG: stage 0 sporulation protein [Betaproteobacteria bacterium]|nr:stage 0 sporulation protein [Betaproteobacteria bacterium]
MQDASYQLIKLAQIDTAPQVRQSMNKEGLQELADDIAARGVIQPIVVRQVGERFRVVMGHRRRFACEMIGKEEVPAIVRETADDEVTELQLIENLQREDLAADDIGLALTELYEKHGSLDTVALLVNKSKSWVAKHIKIATRLHHAARELFEEGVTEDGDYLCALSDLFTLLGFDYDARQRLYKDVRAGKVDREQIRERLAKIKADQAKEAAAKPNAKQPKEKKPKPRAVNALAGDMMWVNKTPHEIFASWMEKEQNAFIDVAQLAWIEGSQVEDNPVALAQAAAVYEKPAFNLARMMGFMAKQATLKRISTGEFEFNVDDYLEQLAKRFPRER